MGEWADEAIDAGYLDDNPYDDEPDLNFSGRRNRKPKTTKGEIPMSSLNEVNLIGHLGKDPEIRTMQSGDRVANFSVATSEKWKDKSSGEVNEKTQWHNIVVWNQGIVGIVDRYLKKGHKVFVKGQLETRKWQDSSGADKYSTEVVLRFNGQIVLLTPQSQSDRDERHEETRQQSKPASKQVQADSFENMEDEIPF